MVNRTVIKLAAFRFSILRSIFFTFSFVAAFVMMGFNAAVAQLEDLSFNYPELHVTPLASDRLRMEAEREPSDQWTRYWPIQAAALTTLVAGSQAKFRQDSNLNPRDKDRYDDSKLQAQAVGGVWLAFTLGMSAMHAPYESAHRKVAALPAGTERERLTKERMAEEALYGPGHLGFTIRWAAAVTNLASSLLLFDKAHDDSKVYIGVATATSLLPLIVKSRWERVADRHREYKKKIYGPIASPTIMPDGQGGVVPGYAVNFSF